MLQDILACLPFFSVIVVCIYKSLSPDPVYEIIGKDLPHLTNHKLDLTSVGMILRDRAIKTISEERFLHVEYVVRKVAGRVPRRPA